MKYSQFLTPSFETTNPTGSRIQGKRRVLRYISSQYHANIPVESIPHHTTQNEFKSKSKSPTSLTVNKNWKLEMWWMSMSRLQSLPKSWRQRHHEQPLGIPGHKRPSLPQRRWNCQTGRCLSRKCSSSKLQLVPGKRESDLEVDQGWHLWSSWNTNETQLSVSDSEFPNNNSHWIQGKCRLLRYISSQYHANIPVESMPHQTTQNEFNSKSISPTSLSQQDLEPVNAKDEHEQITKPFTKLATKTPWAATWNPGTQKAFTPSTPMELLDRSMLVTDLFVFKALASAWPKGKRLGSWLKSVSERIQFNHCQVFKQEWSSHV